jgi:exopolyphosphatase/guanosine-5'-triphosphate,3'-diphosphate pyrophosphatase
MVQKTYFKTKDYCKVKFTFNVENAETVEILGLNSDWENSVLMSKKKDGKPLQIELLRDYYRELDAVPVEDRIIRYNLRSDRADVIVPALLIYINAMRWAGAVDIYVPKIGLADGLIQHLYAEMKEKV